MYTCLCMRKACNCGAHCCHIPYMDCIVHHQKICSTECVTPFFLRDSEDAIRVSHPKATACSIDHGAPVEHVAHVCTQMNACDAWPTIRRYGHISQLVTRVLPQHFNCQDTIIAFFTYSTLYKISFPYSMCMERGFLRTAHMQRL